MAGTHEEGDRPPAWDDSAGRYEGSWRGRRELECAPTFETQARCVCVCGVV